MALDPNIPQVGPQLTAELIAGLKNLAIERNFDSDKIEQLTRRFEGVLQAFHKEINHEEAPKRLSEANLEAYRGFRFVTSELRDIANKLNRGENLDEENDLKIVRKEAGKVYYFCQQVFGRDPRDLQ